MRCLLVDFTKAFDSVEHLTLIVKLKNLNIADHIIQWVVAFLTDRNKFFNIGEKWSLTKIINRSIVQWSGIGHILFIICITDRKPISSTNYITRYADDSSLLVHGKMMLIYLKNYEMYLNGLNTINCRLIRPKQKK